MGTRFAALHATSFFGPDAPPDDGAPARVRRLAETVLAPTLAQAPAPVAALVTATTCPDRLAPSLGQELAAAFPAQLGHAQLLDLVQGCAGGASALVLASQLAAAHRAPVAVVLADATRRATSAASALHGIFGDGAFAALVLPTDSAAAGLLGTRSQAFAPLVEVVTVGLGHDTDRRIAADATPARDPRRYLGLHLYAGRATRLLRRAEGFYQAFTATHGAPDILVLHQAGPGLMTALRAVFAAYPVEVVSTYAYTGNCGAASVGLALHAAWPRAAGRRVLVCGYGTGGVITAGLWQC